MDKSVLDGLPREFIEKQFEKLMNSSMEEEIKKEISNEILKKAKSMLSEILTPIVRSFLAKNANRIISDEMENLLDDGELSEEISEIVMKEFKRYWENKIK
jgi:ATP-dependent Lon protease